MDKKFIGAVEAAEYLGIKLSSLYKLTHNKKIPFYSPTGKRLLFKAMELDKWIECSRVATNDEIESMVQSGKHIKK